MDSNRKAIFEQVSQLAQQAEQNGLNNLACIFHTVNACMAAGEVGEDALATICAHLSLLILEATEPPPRSNGTVH